MNTPVCSNAQTFKKYQVLFAGLLTCAAVLYSQYLVLVDYYRIPGDIFQDIYWMQQFRDAELFVNDPVTLHARRFVSWSVISFYRFWSPVMDPLLMCQLLTVPLYVAASIYLYRLALHMAGTTSALIALGFFLSSRQHLNLMLGGFANSFAYPLCCMLLFYLAKQKISKASLVLTAQALIYPMIFLVCLPVYVVGAIRSQGGLFRARVLAALVLCLGLLFSHYAYHHRWAEVSDVVTRAYMEDKPEFYAKGAVPVMEAGPVIYEVGSIFFRPLLKDGWYRQVKTVLARLHPFLPWAAGWGACVLIVYGLAAGKRRYGFRFPKEIPILLGSSLFFCVLAKIFLFHMYNPNRYIKYTLPLVAVLSVSSGLTAWLRSLRLVPLKKALQGILIVFISIGAFTEVRASKGMGAEDYSEYSSLYAFLRLTPKDSLIAANPYMANGIPAFAARKVLFNERTSRLPFTVTYWEATKRRTLDFIQSYFSENISVVYDFCEKYGVDYLVVNERDFERGFEYFRPFDRVIQNEIKSSRRFCLNAFPDSEKIFESDGVYVIDRSALRKRAWEASTYKDS